MRRMFVVVILLLLPNTVFAQSVQSIVRTTEKGKEPVYELTYDKDISNLAKRRGMTLLRDSWGFDRKAVVPMGSVPDKDDKKKVVVTVKADLSGQTEMPELQSLKLEERKAKSASYALEFLDDVATEVQAKAVARICAVLDVSERIGTPLAARGTAKYRFVPDKDSKKKGKVELQYD